MKWASHIAILIVIFFIVLISHFCSRNVTSFDSAWSIHTAMRIIKEGNTNFKEYIRKRSHQPLDAINVITVYPGVELLIASFIIALTTVFIYFLSSLYLNQKYSLLMAFIFAF